ncbi:MAG TPA: hypothetical protein VIV58_11125 [Kofleriaceae bacterium]
MQTGSRACSECGSSALVPPAELTTDVIAGVTTIAKAPATGWRDTVALLATTLGFFAGMGIGFAIAGPWGATFFGGAAVIGGYNKQFWKTAFTHRRQLLAIAAPAAPVAEAFIGRVQAHTQHLAGGAVAIATTYLLDDGVLVREIESVPFWLITGERRILIDGAIRIVATDPEPVAGAVRALVQLGLPIRRRERARLTAQRIALHPDDKITAKGQVASMQLLDGGYRDNLVDALYGESGRAIWIAREPALR